MVSTNNRGTNANLTHRQLLFVKEYLKTKNGQEAALTAGYSPKTAHVVACHLLNHDKYPFVAAAVEKGLAALEATAIMKATQVRRYVHTVMQFCPGDYFIPVGKGGWAIKQGDYSKLPREVRCLIEEMELKSIIEEDGTEVHLLRCKFISKTVAMGLACRYALVERHRMKFKDETGKKMDWDKLAEEIPDGPMPDPVEGEILSIGYVGPTSSSVEGFATAPPLDPTIETVPNADDLNESCEDVDLEPPEERNGRAH